MVIRQTKFSTVELLDDYRTWLETAVMPELLETLAKDDLPDRQRKIASYSIFKKQLELTILKYTLGEEMENITTNCEKTIDYLDVHLAIRDKEFERRYSQYVLFVWLLSLCLLCGNKPEKILKKIPFIGQDKIIDRLVNCFDRNHEPTDSILFPNIYEPLSEALAEYDEEKRNRLIVVFLENYMTGAKDYDAFWYGSHEETDPNYYCHFGYWAFELAALVADIEWWDDSEFKEHPLYPKDLVDWKTAH